MVEENPVAIVVAAAMVDTVAGDTAAADMTVATVVVMVTLIPIVDTAWTPATHMEASTEAIRAMNIVLCTIVDTVVVIVVDTMVDTVVSTKSIPKHQHHLKPSSSSHSK